jgi:hypothetical protein
MHKISKARFELAVKAVYNGVSFYAVPPDAREGVQELAADDIKDLSIDKKTEYLKLREFGKDLFLTYPKDTPVDVIMKEYVDSIFELIKDNENESI